MKGWKKNVLQCWNVLPLKLQAATASWLWSAQRANTYPLEKQERWLLQLLLETSSPYESHLYTLFRLIDLRVFEIFKGIWKLVVETFTCLSEILCRGKMQPKVLLVEFTYCLCLT